VALSKEGSAIKKKREEDEKRKCSFMFHPSSFLFFGDLPIVAELGHYGRTDSAAYVMT